MTSEPEASRPSMPGYGILPPDEGRGLLPWSWAEERLAASRNYWVSTINVFGAPHVMPVWGVWVDGRLWFSTGNQTRKAVNLGRDARCVFTTERADEAVIVEGRATLAANVPDDVPRLYAEKYGAVYPPSSVFSVRPVVAFGLIEHEAEFAGSATRWTFAD